jgi:tetratricopeptide (TPR) repeat protein
MKKQISHLLLLSAVMTPFFTSPSYGSNALTSSSACDRHEKWSGRGTLPSGAIDDLTDLIDGTTPPALGLSRAYELEKNQNAQIRLLGYYMEGRAMILSGQDDSAMDDFAYVAASGSSDQTGSEIELASMQCIAHTLRSNPGMEVPASVATHLKSLAQIANSPAKKQIVSEIALDTVLGAVSAGKPESDAREALETLNGLGAGSGPYENLARGFMAAERRDHAQTIAMLSPLFPTNAKHSNLPDGLKHEETRGRLVLARAYYATQHFEDAIAQYQKIDRRSNEISEVLSELSWTYLQEKRYGEAVGTAVNLHLGDMRGTFTPESLEVASMSLNELCQFQDSLRTVSTLEHDYEPSYQWLKNKSNSGSSLYQLAIAYLKSSSGEVPAKVANEWIRAPLFLSGQSEIHRLFGAKDRYNALISSIKDEMSDAKKESQESLRQAVLILQQRQAATLDSAERARIRWVDRINAELARRNARMLSELEDVRQNSRMVKIEIYNSASHDMIWLRAHPEFKGDKKYVSEKSSSSGSDVWNWGKVDPNSDSAEVWEDEVGSFKAHLQDHCAAKDKYLGVSTASR